jgi:general secretion pathway protein K
MKSRSAYVLLQLPLHRQSPAQRQRGVAVIMALLLTTLAITIVASLFWQQQVQVRSIENQRLQLQKQWILRGALDWAALILREDKKHSNTNVDTLDEPWAVPLAETRLDQYVEKGHADSDIADATLSGSISDAQARYNLANLCTHGFINPLEVDVFAQILTNAHLNPALAQATADEMAVTQKLSFVDAQNPGTKNTDTKIDQPAEAMPMQLTQVEDLLAVPGFTPEMLTKLKDFVIFLPDPTSVNVNTASAEVLAAKVKGLSLDDARRLVENRNNIATFKDPADFSNRLPGTNHEISGSEISVMTNYFLVNGKVRMNRVESEVQALIKRNDQAVTSLVWIREY